MTRHAPILALVAFGLCVGSGFVDVVFGDNTSERISGLIRFAVGVLGSVTWLFGEDGDS
jgi:hypothetical protein